MNQQDSEFWKRQYERQKTARIEAEGLLENKSLELYRANESLKELNKNLEEQLQTVREKDEAREAAEQSANAKTMFLANMSHEIRTPLNGIISMNRLLMESDLSLEQQKFAESVQTSANSLLRIINDILDISKVEAGELEIEEETFGLLEKLESTFEINQLKAESKGLQFIVNYAPDLPQSLVGDSTRLRQILVNLIANAIKFTSEGMVSIEIKATPIALDNCKLHFRVSDTGIGMDETTRSRVFEPFKQGDSSINRRFGGTGLGLPICKSLIEKMGGSIQCDSEKNKGTVFDVWLPFGIKNRQTSTRFGSHCGKTLLTSDVPLRRSALENLLTFLGLNPESNQSASGYFEKLQNETHCAQCLWLIDIFGFNDHDHQKLKAQLAQKPDYVVPIIIDNISDTATQGQLRYFEYSKIAFPNTLRELSDKLCKVCNVACSSNPSRISSVKINISKPESVKLLLAEDNEINQVAAKITLEKFGFQVLIANDGKEVLEILAKHGVDLILMDINMPGMDGIEACRIIRSTGSQIPIIALTANAMKGDREKFIEYGMNDYLSKPLDVLRLKTVLETYLQHGEDGDSTTGSFDHSSTDPNLKIPDMVNLDRLVPKLGNDQELINNLLEKFDSELRKNANAAMRSLEANDIKQATSCFHLLSGSAATLEIGEIQSVTKSIELLLKDTRDVSQIGADLKRFRQSIENWNLWFSQYKAVKEAEER